MLSKRLAPILAIALLLLPLAASAASTPAPTTALVPASWLLAPARCAERATPGQPMAGPAANPLGLGQEKALCTDPAGCEAFCNDVCAPCGGFPVGQCIQNLGRPGCHSICSCYSC